METSTLWKLGFFQPGRAFLSAPRILLLLTARALSTISQFCFCLVNASARSAWPLLIALALLTSPAAGQEALQASIARERAAAQRTKTLENQEYNIKLGRTRLLIEAAFNAEFNDNVSFRNQDPQEDLILRPQVNLRSYTPVTDRNTLNFSIGLGYNKYLEHADYDYLLLSPGSELDFEVFIRDVRLNFYDRFSYTQDPLEHGSVSRVGNFGGLDNTVGLNAAWDLNRAMLSAGYGHALWLSSNEEYEYLDRSAEHFYTRLSIPLNSTIVSGLEGTASLTGYDLNLLDDHVSSSVGPFAVLKLSSLFQVTPRVGYVTYNFDSSGLAGPMENESTWYFEVDVSHTLNQYATFLLKGGRDVRTGIYAGLEERYYVRNSVQWRVNQKVILVTQFFYENVAYPPLYFRSNQPFLLSGDTYDRYGAGASLSVLLTKKLQLGLAYRYSRKNSEQDSWNYQQNAVTLGWTYRF